MAEGTDAPTRVLVVEDEPKVLKQLLRMLRRRPELEVVGSAMNGEQALEQLAAARPDVLLLDLGLPGMNGIEVTRQARERQPGLEVLIFTVFDDEGKVLEAVQAGASGYLLKGATTEKIVEAIQEVKAGGSVIQPNLARSLLRVFRDATASEPPLEDIKPLSPRETEVLELIAKGLSNNEAAGVLGLSRATVRTHLEHIYAKLDVTNRVEAITQGIRHGIIEV